MEARRVGGAQVNRETILRRCAGLYTLASLGGLIVAKVGSPLLVGAAFAAALWGALPDEKREIRLPSIPDAAGAFIILAFIVGRILSGTDVLAAFVEGLLIFQASRWLFGRDTRDLFILSGVAYVEIIAAAASTTSLLFLPVFVASTLLTSVILFLTYAHEENRESSTEKRTVPVSGSFLGLLGTAGLFSLLITGLIFLTLPRLGVGFLSGLRDTGRGKAAFPGSVSLEEKVFASRDKSVVARLKGPDSLTPPIYLRGLAASTFDGRAWLKETGRFPARSAGSRWFIVSRRPDLSLEEMEVIQEGTGQASLLLPPGTVEVRWKWGRLSVDREGNVYSPLPISRPVKFRVSVSRKGELSLPLKSPSRNGPDEAVPEVIRKLAEELKLREVSPEEAAGRIAAHLRARCRYERSPDRVSLEEFLTGRKAGNCQHFATATVLLLREAGIRARFAGGFVTSEYNEVGGYWMFRQRDAHAWAEADLGDGSWRVVDTTPPSTGSPPPAKVSHFLDWVREAWFEYVIGYDLEKQVRISRSVMKKTASLTKMVRREGKKFIAPAALLFVFACLAFFLKRRAPGGSAPGKRAHHLLARRILLPVVKKAGRRGFRKREGETPREFLARLIRGGLLPRDETLRFLSLYESLRFGRREGGVEDLRLLRDSLLRHLSRRTG
ncbi:MAG: DUF3488 domain-containing protein [Deltaproteobacteria bacterium]|nr:MAG: DUF3488 domain-containing protein [Deltaproteobacteria bacterium]